MSDSYVFIIFLVILPFILSAMARAYLTSRYFSALRKSSAITGAAIARAILDSANLQSITIERISGDYSVDHYDARIKILQLSEKSYNGRNLAAIGTAAHEACHAIQDKRQPWLTSIRQLTESLSSFGSVSSLLFILLGIGSKIHEFLFVGMISLGITSLLQIVNLPIEYNASNLAKRQLEDLKIFTQNETQTIHTILNATVLTYIVAMSNIFIVPLYFLEHLCNDSRSRD